MATNGIIQDLEARAEKLKLLLDGRVAKRPLIIEFSGSPKAGKTRSIQVLELFLRRNGIRVETFLERASVSPIKAKGHLYFNTWASCASLQGLLEAIYKDDIDVFILDRGIFDALVWNHFLETTGKISPDEAVQSETFFTMPRWLEAIELVVMMTCEPATSIEREYVDQLTLKRGTIMQEGTLRQFNDALTTMRSKHSHRFKKIIHLDTTALPTRTGVIKITAQALQSLNDLLDEMICVVPKDAIRKVLPPEGFIADPATIQDFLLAVEHHRLFLPRSEAEINSAYFQPIPCAVLIHQNEVLFLKRNEPGHSLHDTYAVWAGGHVVKADDSNDNDILLRALRRELAEEVYIKDNAYLLSLAPIGLMRTSESERASRHIGVIYQATLSTSEVALALDQKEFRETRGTSVSGKLVHILCPNRLTSCSLDHPRGCSRSIRPLSVGFLPGRRRLDTTA